jgi:peptidoglycan/LPS O-acetylase OafA/YrhL
MPDEVARLRSDVAAALTYVTNWYLIFHQQSYFEAVGRPSPLGHLWSLAVEEQFYVVWPLALVGLLRVTRSHRQRAAIVGTVAAVVTCVRPVLFLTGTVSGERAYFGSDLRADALLLGCVLAVAQDAGWLEGAAGALRRLRWPAIATLVLVAVSRVSPFDATGLVLMTFVALSAAALIAVAVVAPEEVPVLRWRPLVRVGVLSYAFYLWHVPVMALLDVPAVLRLVVGLPVAFAAAVISQRAVERPALRWKRRFESATSSANGVEAGAIVL